MTFLENLKSENQFPIIFIGSGITQRYFLEAPTWDELLKSLWSELKTDKNYYSKYNELKTKYSEDVFKIYTNLASDLEKIFNINFFAEDIKIENLSPEKAHINSISPFKTKISKIFANLKKRTDSNLADELVLFRSMLIKSRLIVTTNYDNFIEQQLNNDIKVMVGNKGLFEPSSDLNELYKIHGSIENPNSIIITDSDYNCMDRTSAIINAKLLSHLIESPILFISYSLTDKNIQSLLKDLANNMPFSINDASKRIGVVKYKANENKVLESMSKTDYGIVYTELATNNYSEIYSSISKIDQGITPSELFKYKDMFKTIIDDRGKAGKLDKVLTSFVDLNNNKDYLQNSKLVVAFGDSRNIYIYPDYVSYIKSYFLEDNPMPFEIAIEFISNRYTENSPLPIYKFINGKSNSIKESEKVKINKRLKKFSSLCILRNNVTLSKSNESKLKEYSDKSPIEILQNTDDGIEEIIKIAYFVKFIDKENDIRDLVLFILKNKNDNFIKKTFTRKLMMIYSLISEDVIFEI